MTQAPSRHASGTLGHLVDQAAARLAAAGIETARLDARVLAAHALGRDPSFILTHSETVPSDREAEFIERLIVRREEREPVSRIVGLREFWSMPFRVTEATLTPRPETETLVEHAVRRISESGQGKSPLRVLDLGTGTGCLLLAVLSELPQATGLGIDINADAVAVAQENARNLNLAERARFQTGNWAAGIVGPFDVILSNPPYIAERERSSLPPEVRDFDPPAALFAGGQGLDAYAAIAPQAANLLAPAGFVIVELGQGQEADVAKIFADAGMTVCESQRDLLGIARSLCLGKPG